MYQSSISSLDIIYWVEVRSQDNILFHFLCCETLQTIRLRYTSLIPLPLPLPRHTLPASQPAQSRAVRSLMYIYVPQSPSNRINYQTKNIFLLHHFS